MKALNFKEANIEIAKSQDEYFTLPAHKDGSNQDITTICWELDEEEIQQVIRTGCIWTRQLCFKQSYHPIYNTFLKPKEFTQPETIRLINYEENKKI